MNLSNNNLNGSIPTELGNLNRLKYLNLAFNQLSGNIPNSIGNLVSLEEIRLFQNELSGSIPQELGNLNALTHVNFRNNNLSGSIPASIGNLNSLEILYLHNNNLNGYIPSEIFGLTNLKRLFLHNNQLSGTLEENISDLISLDRFRIEYNDMSGVISQNICNLGLQWADSISFNISNNMFCEPYPFCVQGIQGYQDTLNCGSMKILEENSIPFLNRLKVYPNPFNPNTTISIELNGKKSVRVEIVDLLGKKVKLLFNGILQSGVQLLKWDGRNEYGLQVSPGIYFGIVKSDYSQEIIKLIMLK